MEISKDAAQPALVQHNRVVIPLSVPFMNCHHSGVCPWAAPVQVPEKADQNRMWDDSQWYHVVFQGRSNTEL